MPATTALDCDEIEVRSLLTLEPVVGTVRGLANERAVRLPRARRGDGARVWLDAQVARAGGTPLLPKR